MGQKTFNLKLTCTVLIGLLCLIAFYGCSKIRNFTATDSSLQSQWTNKSGQQKAYHEFSSKIRAYQESPDSTYRRACYFQERKKHKLALLEFKTIVEIDPSYVMAYNGMGISYDSLGKFDLAADSYKRALTLNPKLDYVYNNLGYSYLLQNELDTAIEAFKKAIALKENDKKYHNNLGMAYAKKGLFPLAFEEFTLAADERAASHNLALFRKLNNTHSHVADRFATLHSTGQARGNATDQINLRAKPAKSMAPKLNEELRTADFETTLKSSTQKDQETSEKPPNQKYETFHIQVATYKYLENATKVKENLTEIGYRGDIDMAKGEDSPLYVVKVGSFKSRSNAASSAEKIKTELAIEPLVIPLPHTKTPFEKKIDRRAETDAHLLPKAPEIKTPQSQISLTGVGIEISNGNGVNRMASKIAHYLQEKGYVISRVTNATHFSHEKTKIYYCEGYLQQAYRLAKEIPGWNEMEKTEMSEKIPIRIRVLIGKDLVPFATVLGREKHKEFS
jgi:tetratricopeptide (TPR) repeat protein